MKQYFSVICVILTRACTSLSCQCSQSTCLRVSWFSRMRWKVLSVLQHFSSQLLLLLLIESYLWEALGVAKRLHWFMLPWGGTVTSLNTPNPPLGARYSPKTGLLWCRVFPEIYWAKYQRNSLGGQSVVCDGRHCSRDGSTLSCEEVGGLALNEVSGHVAVLPCSQHWATGWDQFGAILNTGDIGMPWRGEMRPINKKWWNNLLALFQEGQERNNLQLCRGGCWPWKGVLVVLCSIAWIQAWFI